MNKGALALVVVLATACGGAGGAASGVTTGGASPTGTSASGSAARPFRDIVGAANSSPYKVTYRVSSTAGGQAMSSMQTWYVSGQRFRMDLAVTQGTTTGSVSIFATPDGTYSCVSGSGSAAQCLGLPQAEAYAQSPAASFDAAIRQNPDSFGASFAGTRTIAGTNASCYGVSGTAVGFSQGTICYTNTGVPLLYQFDASGLSFTMEATAFSVPTDADFALPVPAQRYP